LLRKPPLQLAASLGQKITNQVGKRPYRLVNNTDIIGVGFIDASLYERVRRRHQNLICYDMALRMLLL